MWHNHLFYDVNDETVCFCHQILDRSIHISRNLYLYYNVLNTFNMVRFPVPHSCWGVLLTASKQIKKTKTICLSHTGVSRIQSTSPNLKESKADEILLSGDIISCGGFLVNLLVLIPQENSRQAWLLGIYDKITRERPSPHRS